MRRELVRRLIADPPDLFLGVDAPDFNLGVEEKLRARGIRTVQYVAPQCGPGAAIGCINCGARSTRCCACSRSKLRSCEQAGVPATYVGHPLADQVPEVPDRQSAREQFRLSSAHTVVALLPGSRVREVETMGELFIRSAQLIHRQVRNVHFLVPLLSRPTRGLFEQTLYRLEAQDLPLTILFGHAQMAMTAADSVLLASGTASLEAALLKRPMVVTYRLAPMTYALIRRRGYRLPYVALPNILAGRFVVPEILQDDATPENLAQAVLNQLGDKVVRQRQERAFLDMHHGLASKHARKSRRGDRAPVVAGRRPGPLAGPAPAPAAGA